MTCPQYHIEWNDIMDIHFILQCCVISKRLKWLCVMEKIIMENCELESLKECMDIMGELNEDAQRGIASCCLLGLDFLHSHHIIHGVVER